MIKVDRILKQSWRILWSYRVLWIFGILLALTAGGSSGPNADFNDNGVRQTTPPDVEDLPVFMQEITRWFEQNVEPLAENPEQHIGTFIWIGVALTILVLVISLITALVRYPAETAVIRMVDDYEQTGTKVGFRAGWRLGWNRRAFRIWVIDLIIGLPVFLFVLFMLTLGLVILISVSSGSEGVAIGVSLLAVWSFFLVLLVFIALMIFITLLRQLFIREAALDGLGVVDSIRSGWALFKKQWKNTGLMFLVMIGIGIAFGLISIVLFFVLIPLYLVLFLPAVVVAGLPGLIAYGITSLFSPGPLAWIIGFLAAMPFFFIVLFAPLFLVSGWYSVYESSVWTLTYREIKALSGQALAGQTLRGPTPPEPVSG